MFINCFIIYIPLIKCFLGHVKNKLLWDDSENFKVGHIRIIIYIVQLKWLN